METNEAGVRVLTADFIVFTFEEILKTHWKKKEVVRAFAQYNKREVCC